MYWKLHDERKHLVAGFKGYLDNLLLEARRRIILGILAAFAVLTLYTSGRAVHNIGGNDGSRMETGYTRRVKLPALTETDNHLTPYLYGMDEE